MMGDGGSVGGPNDDFPTCTDLKYEVWRFWTYQFVHVGYSHVCYNVFLQLLAGIPLETVHGSWRLFALYQVGVICGSMSTGLADGMALTIMPPCY
jgi:membrane associated rhomboid family serine protease